jgi:hypothetical protein
MVMTPPVVVALIDVLANDHVISIVHHNLRGNRTGANQHCPNGRA